MVCGGKRRILHGSRNTEVKLWTIGDLHIGSVGCNWKSIHQAVAAINADPFSFWIGLGDYAEFISPKDRRFDAASIEEWIAAKDIGKLGMCLTRKVRDTLEPIKEKCLGLLFGNHEHKYQIQTEQQELHSWLCKELGIPNLGYSCFLDCLFSFRAGKKKPELISGNAEAQESERTDRFRIFAHHGAGAAQTPGGKLNRLHKFMTDFEADIYLVAHLHDQKTDVVDYLAADDRCDHIVYRRKYGMLTAPCLETYHEGPDPLYGEVRGYSPTPIGVSHLIIKPWTREIFFA